MLSVRSDTWRHNWYLSATTYWDGSLGRWQFPAELQIYGGDAYAYPLYRKVLPDYVQVTELLGIKCVALFGNEAQLVYPNDITPIFGPFVDYNNNFSVGRILNSKFEFDLAICRTNQPNIVPSNRNDYLFVFHSGGDTPAPTYDWLIKMVWTATNGIPNSNNAQYPGPNRIYEEQESCSDLTDSAGNGVLIAEQYLAFVPKFTTIAGTYQALPGTGYTFVEASSGTDANKIPVGHHVYDQTIMSVSLMIKSRPRSVTFAEYQALSDSRLRDGVAP